MAFSASTAMANKLGHEENAASPMLITLLGMVTVASFEQRENTPTPRFATPSGRVTSVRPSQ